jgi:hypothetical protein
MGKKRADKANRAGVAERGADAVVHKSIAGDLARLPSDDALLREGELPIVNTAKPPDANPLSLRHTVPGRGTKHRLVLHDDLPDGHRCPRGQEVGASCRLVPGGRASAGNRDGTAGAKSGQAHLQWACAAAALLCLSDHPAAHKYRAHVAKIPAQGQAVTILAQPLARAVSDRRQRPGVFAREKCCQRYTRREGSG